MKKSVFAFWLVLISVVAANAVPGKLDATFGGKGYRFDGFGNGYDSSEGSVLQPDGKIVMVGHSTRTGGISANYDIVVSRYNPDGSFDLSFGDDGRVIYIASALEDQGRAIALQSDGKVVIGGFLNGGGSGRDAFVARLNADGSFDDTFDGDGVVVTALTGADDSIMSIAVQMDGKIFAVGTAGPDNAIMRYNTDGSLDTQFDGDGIRVLPAASSALMNRVALQADGKIMAGGGFGGDFAVVRFNTDGSSDTSFDGDGMAVVPGTNYVWGLTIQPDGKILAGGSDAAGDFAVARLNTDGSIDTSFDGDGLSSVSTNAGPENIWSLALQTDGKIVAAGYAQPAPTANSDFAVARFNTNGSLDTSFNGTGFVLTAVAAVSDLATSVLIQSDGKIVATGRANGSSDDFALVRYNTNGSLDTSFNGTGVKLSDVGNGLSPGNAVAVQVDGKIVAATGSIGGFTLVRYNENGTRDHSFGTRGKVITTMTNGATIYDILIQPDGKILAAGSTGFELDRKVALARYNTNGTLDSSFDGDGILISTIGIFAPTYASQVELAPDGKIVIAGGALNFQQGTYYFLVGRYNSNGTPDTTFDGDGFLTTIILMAQTYSALAVQADGKIVVGGRNQNSGFCLLRYNLNGTPDVPFGGGAGIVVTPMGTSNNSGVNSLQLLPDGRILAGGVASNGSNTDFAMARYLSNGALDASFDFDGKLLSPIGGGNDTLASLAIQTDGKIVAAGDASGPGTFEMAFARYHPDGSLDLSYGTSGKSMIDLGYNDRAYAMTLDATDRVVAAGISWNFTVMRLRSGNEPLTTLGGRLMSIYGNPIANVMVVATDENLNSQFALSNGFGYYTFSNITLGGTYIISMSSKRFDFFPLTRTVPVTGAIIDADFTGYPNEGQGGRETVTGPGSQPVKKPEGAKGTSFKPVKKLVYILPVKDKKNESGDLKPRKRFHRIGIT